MANGSVRQKRLTLVVNQPEQSRFIVATAWAPALCFASIAIMLGVFYLNLADETTSSGIQPTGILPVFLACAVFLFAGTVLTVFNCLKTSSRVMGPGYRFGKVLQEVQDGNLAARIVLRKGDYLTGVGADVNRFLGWLEDHPPTGVEWRNSSEVAETEGSPATSESAAVGAANGQQTVRDGQEDTPRSSARAAATPTRTCSDSVAASSAELKP